MMLFMMLFMLLPMLLCYSSAANFFLTSSGISASPLPFEPPAWRGVVPSPADVDGGCYEAEAATEEDVEDEEFDAVILVGGPL